MGDRPEYPLQARGIMRAVLREPLFHFLVLGAALFAANALLYPAARNAPHRVEVSGADIDRIQALYRQQWGAAPKSEEMPDLLESHIRSEVLFREGMALGLAADDPVLRNRVIQKMEFLLQSSTAIAPPSDAEMTAYFNQHQATYRLPEQVLFSQAYFSPSRRGARAETDARKTLEALRVAPTMVVTAGDPLMLPADPSPQSSADLEKDYGPDFAAALFALPSGNWQGPLHSALGLHLVRIEARHPARPPSFAEVRDRVHDDMVAERLREASHQAFERIRSRYRVVVAPNALPTATSPMKAENPR